MPRGHETVLLVEDEAAVRSLVTKILSRLGYRVLEANSIASAAEQWSRHRDHIHILLTDIVMPGGMTGIELSELFLKDRPDLKILYSSGYSAELAGKNLLLKEGANFLSKPYDPRTLARSLRASLDSR
jgi:CheY-like chemotaxis protein